MSKIILEEKDIFDIVNEHYKTLGYSVEDIIYKVTPSTWFVKAKLEFELYINREK